MLYTKVYICGIIDNMNSEQFSQRDYDKEKPRLKTAGLLELLASLEGMNRKLHEATQEHEKRKPERLEDPRIVTAYLTKAAELSGSAKTLREVTEQVADLAVAMTNDASESNLRSINQLPESSIGSAYNDGGFVRGEE